MDKVKQTLNLAYDQNYQSLKALGEYLSITQWITSLDFT